MVRIYQIFCFKFRSFCDKETDFHFLCPRGRKLRDESDIIITNPPFSLFREFLNWILTANKKFIILGNVNAITYKEIFPSILNPEATQKKPQTSSTTSTSFFWTGLTLQSFPKPKRGSTKRRYPHHNADSLPPLCRQHLYRPWKDLRLRPVQDLPQQEHTTPPTSPGTFWSFSGA